MCTLNLKVRNEKENVNNCEVLCNFNKILKQKTRKTGKCQPLSTKGDWLGFFLLKKIKSF